MVHGRQGSEGILQNVLKRPCLCSLALLNPQPALLLSYPLPLCPSLRPPRPPPPRPPPPPPPPPLSCRIDALLVRSVFALLVSTVLPPHRRCQSSPEHLQSSQKSVLRCGCLLYVVPAEPTHARRAILLCPVVHTYRGSTAHLHAPRHVVVLTLLVQSERCSRPSSRHAVFRGNIGVDDNRNHS